MGTGTGNLDPETERLLTEIDAEISERVARGEDVSVVEFMSRYPQYHDLHREISQLIAVAKELRKASRTIPGSAIKLDE